jgi:putative membrane protein
MMGIGMTLNMIFWIVLIGFGIYGIVLLIMKPFEKKEDPALQLLREQFAKGEIDEGIYREKKAVLLEK